MIIDNLNLNHLRLFECVYRTKNMTKAAEELHLTQSGMSQHIKSLEDNLGVKLFDRVRQRLVPTKAGATLYEHCHKGLHNIESAIADIKGIKKELSGHVTIGIPVEFGNNIVLPLLSQFCKKHPRVSFNIRYGYASEMNELILNGDLDFAFVDAFGFDRRIHTEVIYGETLVLCASREYMKKHEPIQFSKKYFETLNYVCYVPGEPLLRMWFKHHLKHGNLQLNMRATAMDVQGIAHLILLGVGVGVLPRHHILKIGRTKNKFYIFESKEQPLKNSISIASLRERSHSQATKVLLGWLLDQFKTKTH